MAETDAGSSSTNIPPKEPGDASATKFSPSVRAHGPRKRTKTGCLTCRKRRIKCGEEKPICNNCVKSRRECEGYGQRVIFRQPVGPIPHLGPIAPAPPNVPGAIEGELTSNLSAYPVYADGTGSRPSFLPLAPRPHPYHGTRNISQNVSPSDGPPTSLGPGYAHPDTEASQRTEPGNSLHELQYPQHTGCLQPNGSNADYAPGQVHPSLQTSTAAYSRQFPSSTQYPGQSDLTSFEQHNLTTTDGRGAVHFPSNFAPRQFQYVMCEDEDEDDDYDVETGDEIDQQREPSIPSDRKPWAMVLAPGHLDQGNQPFTTYISYNNLLVNYRPSPSSSPLRDPEAAQIFSHFITTLGPAISIFERRPATLSLMTREASPSSEYGSLWTYVIPSMALEHPALLHAILAMSSLHLAMMAGQPSTASFRHYHFALRRIRKAVGLPNRRTQIATLAATLLISYYEILDAEHSKWSSHVAGGCKLIQETNFAGMTKNVRDMRARTKAEQTHFHEQRFWPGAAGANDDSGIPGDVFARVENCVDERLVSVLMGRPVSYDDFRHVSGGIGDYQTKQNLTEKDLDDFRIRCDLYWWYCKQDLYRSLISGSRLLMPYHQWGQCPPRAGIGDLDAVYGSADHMILLLARIAEFGAIDRQRKIKVIDAKLPRQNSPPMYGMAPSGPVRLPAGFAETPSPVPPHSPSETSDKLEDLDALTAQAESEWHDMVAACEEFANSLGPGFAPLPPDTTPSIQTPFGPALQYRTQTVAIIWAWYYTCRILLQRVHPSMPPAAMMAAGVAAAETTEYAHLIGRVVGGIHTAQPQHLAPNDASPSFCGVLAETQICLFYAGVQLTSQEQRGWLIALLLDMRRLTGNRSTAAIAGGCEAAWKKAYKAGRGPPYESQSHPEYNVQRYATLDIPGSERRFVTVTQGDSLRWAMGLLSVEGVYPE